MELDEFRRALRAAADRPDTDVARARATVGDRAYRRRVRRRSLVSLVVIVAALAIAVGLVALPKPDSQHQILSVVPKANEPTSSPAVASATAAQLAAGRWAALPPAPIPARDGASVVWTGHEMIVWGGATGRDEDRLRADGAAYDPATKSWRVLAPAPLSARIGQTAVWSGTEMIVWGGYDVVNSLTSRAANDGAAYNPSTNSWRRIAPSPLSARSDAIAVWTGDEMIVLGGASARAANDGAVYDPATNRWSALAMPVPLAGHPLTWDIAVQAGPGELLAWSQWATTAELGSGSESMSGGADLFLLDETTRRWTDVHTASSALPTVETVLWTGSRAVVRGITYNCGNCPGPFVPEVTDFYTPGSNAWRRLPPDPLGGDEMESAWTGSALFSFNGDAIIGAIGPGDASVYDPSTDAWTRLRRSPFGCGSESAAPIWTGGQVLLYCPTKTAGGLALVPNATTAARSP